MITIIRIEINCDYSNGNLMVKVINGEDLRMIYPLVNVYSLLLKMAIQIVDLPINSVVIFHSYVSLPEGNL